ncbi:MAG: hypothetical protein ACI80M_000721 [Gammaproteobacteria bacterium]|jgi:hypothetical protein
MRLKSQSALGAIVSNGILACLLVIASSAHATTIAFEDFESGSNGWLDRGSTAPTSNATGGHDGGAYISFVGDIATNTAAFGTALVEFRCQTAACNNNNTFNGDWIAQDVTTLSYWFKHSSDSDLQAYIRLAPISGVGGGAASAITLGEIASNTWTQIVVNIDPSQFDPSFGGGNYANIMSNMYKIQPGIFFPFGESYTETGVIFALDDVRLSAVPVPAAVWLFGSGLALLFGYKGRRSVRAAA